ncbi:hypothetical protein KC660_01160 [Candidatus Dojkabacteria bacterium]|uniref:Uncharacterized protein n=1 Tax=Candidatus Dojkabacteria bacterium TaxID=2099670 RepID=A0A955L312_9BACT|nr:hypothetical protein [Candidatus Dojkabacteria bacterium]
MNLLHIITPINLAEEEEKFFASDNYNPIFEYDWDNVNLDKLDLTRNKDKLIYSIINQDILNLVVNAETFFETELDEAVLQQAKSIVSNPPEKVPPQNISDLAKRFEEVFKEFSINFKVEVVDQKGFNIRPLNIGSKLIISKYANMDFFTIEGEIRHELVHIIRYLNGKFNNISWSANYLPTEEGLATCMHDYSKANRSDASLFQHASEYAVTEICLSGSLRDAFNFLVNIGLSEELAYQRVVRHKMGFVDTSKPGDIMKPAMYFYHSLKVSKLSNNEKLILFNGKISVDEIKDYDGYKGVIEKGKVEGFYRI